MFTSPSVVLLKNRMVTIKPNCFPYLQQMVNKREFLDLLEKHRVKSDFEHYLFVVFLNFLAEYDTEPVERPDGYPRKLVTIKKLSEKLDESLVTTIYNDLSEYHKVILFSLAYISTEGLNLEEQKFLTRISKAISESPPGVIDTRKLAYAGMVDSKRDLW